MEKEKGVIFLPPPLPPTLEKSNFLAVFHFFVFGKTVWARLFGLCGSVFRQRGRSRHGHLTSISHFLSPLFFSFIPREKRSPISSSCWVGKLNYVPKNTFCCDKRRKVKQCLRTRNKNIALNLMQCKFFRSNAVRVGVVCCSPLQSRERVWQMPTKDPPPPLCSESYNCCKEKKEQEQISLHYSPIGHL